MLVLETSCILKLCMLACTLLAAGAHEFDWAFVSHLFETADRGSDAALAFREQRKRAVVAEALRGLQKRVERDNAKWIEAECRNDPAALADAHAAIAALDDLLPRCLPNSGEVIAAEYDVGKIIRLVLDKAAFDENFREPKIGARLLARLMLQTFAALLDDEKFCDATEIPFRKAMLVATNKMLADIGTVLVGIGELKEGQKAAEQAARARHAEFLAIEQARKERDEKLLAAVMAEKGAPLPVLREILAGFGEAALEQDVTQIAQRLRAKADDYNELIERLNRLTNDDPRVQTLRQEAATSIQAGKFDEADAKLSRAEAIDMAAVEEVEAIAARRRASAAASRAERAAAARLRLDYRAAAAHFVAAARIVARDDRSAWSYTLEQASALDDQGREFGDNPALREAIAAYGDALRLVPRNLVPLDWATTQNDLGTALATLGQRESGTARLEQAVEAYRAALGERTRERVPLGWAGTQNNLGLALATLGEREGGTARLEQAVAAYRAALEEYTRERVPLDWAMTQNNLGNALQRLGARESGTARLEQAVAAYRAALDERTRERVPLDWAMTQNNLGTALQTLGERESGTARLEQAVAAYRAALDERTRERVPLGWATTQNNLGAALQTLGARESGTARLEQAVAAYRAALEEYTRERVPLDWAGTQNNLGAALETLGERESGTARLEQAVAACRAALEERTRERVPLDWAATQYNLANALDLLARRTNDPARMAEALGCMRGAAEVFREAGVDYWRPIAEQRAAEIAAELAKMRAPPPG